MRYGNEYENMGIHKGYGILTYHRWRDRNCHTYEKQILLSGFHEIVCYPTSKDPLQV